MTVSKTAMIIFQTGFISGYLLYLHDNYGFCVSYYGRGIHVYGLYVYVS
jgi:hypothetical protein